MLPNDYGAVAGFHRGHARAGGKPARARGPRCAREHPTVKTRQWSDRGQPRHARGRDRLARHLDRRWQPERGARAEHGIAHFLEHMAFKGTARRSAQDIAEEIEAVGGELNAATGVDSTAYYARVMRKDMPLALDILSDIILAPRFDRTELARERDVILQEIAAAMDSPGRYRLRPCAGGGLSRSAGRAADPRHGREREQLQARPSRRLSFRALSWPQHGARRGRRGRSSRLFWPRPSGGLRRFDTEPAPPAPSRRLCGRREALGARHSSRPISCSPSRAGLPPRRLFHGADLRRRARRRHVLAALPGSARAARALLRHLRIRQRADR